jgi:hypothetical protein
LKTTRPSLSLRFVCSEFLVWKRKLKIHKNEKELTKEFISKKTRIISKKLEYKNFWKNCWKNT